MRRLFFALFVVLAACSGDDDGTAETTKAPSTTTTEAPLGTAPTPTTVPRPAGVTVTVEGGQVTASADRISVDQGDTVRFTVTSDVADEVHVHGYEIKRAVAAGETVVVEFEADLPGVWEVELEGAGLHLLDVEVS